MERNKKRNVLFFDEHGKAIVYVNENDTIRIAVDNEHDANYVTLWFYTGGTFTKNGWCKHGYLRAMKDDYKFRDLDTNTLLPSCSWLSIKSIEINKKHRKKGYGTMLYQILADFSGDDICGFFSYLPNRSNKKQVPKIYKKFGAITEGDYQFVKFDS